MSDEPPSPAVVKGQLMVLSLSAGQTETISVRTKSVPRVAA